MKTKFSELLKIKKQKVSEIENQLASMRQKKREVEEEIRTILEQIQNFALPKTGNFSLLQQAHFQKTTLFKQKETKENMVKYFDQEIENLNYIYKEANIAYEKIKHLHLLEEKKFLDALAKEESKRMDEVANQLFLRRQKKGSV